MVIFTSSSGSVDITFPDESNQENSITLSPVGVKRQASCVVVQGESDEFLPSGE